jgi:hypothetical protein
MLFRCAISLAPSDPTDDEVDISLGTVARPEDVDKWG